MGYTSISLPKELVDEIDRVRKNKKHAYGSTAEFVKDAVRRRLEELAVTNTTEEEASVEEGGVS